MTHRRRIQMTFEQLGLGEATLAAVREMGYEEPTPVQAQAIPAVLAGRDVMAAAQTGTGKTAAFILPTLDRLGRAQRGRGPLMLVVTPTRELAAQITDVAKAVCAITHHRPVTVVGGVGYEPQKQALKRGCDLLVATPGRLIDLMEQDAAHLADVEVLVLDEADRMLDMGFLPAMRKIVAATPKDRQTLLFSATLGPDVLEHTNDLVRDPVRVEIAPKGTAAETVDQYVLGATPAAKKRVLTQVLELEGADRVLVFVRGKHRADHLCRVLKRKGFEAQAIHGDRSQNQRTRALAQFSAGEVGVLVATDVLARGIDIPEVSCVLNLDVPHEAEDYIHRIGRTGRAGEKGWALTVCTEDEYLDLRDIEQLMGKVIPEYPRAGQIDAGDRPFALDPNRKATDKLPSKKTRKKIARKKRDAQQAAAQAQVETGQETEADSQERRPSAGSAPHETQPSRQGETQAKRRRRAPKSRRGSESLGDLQQQQDKKKDTQRQREGARPAPRKQDGRLRARRPEGTGRQKEARRTYGTTHDHKSAGSRQHRDHTQNRRSSQAAKPRRHPGDRRGMNARRG